MGGTVLATIALDGMLYWISVGDSPLYLFRDGRLTRLNADHSLAPQIDLMVSRGMMDAETGANHPQRNCLTSAIIGEAIPEIDCPDAPFELMSGDLVVAASDGLQFIGDSEIEAILRHRHRAPCAQVVNALMAGVDAAQDPEQDNISVVVMKAVAECDAAWVGRSDRADANGMSWKETVSPRPNLSARS